jgi:predicted amidohydrolase YtcJ
VTGLLLRNAELDGRRVTDVRVRDGLVSQVGTGFDRQADEDEYDCAGAAVLPGLCDHHLHLHAMAAWGASVRCGPPEVTDRTGLATALTAALLDGRGWIRGVGYHESVAGDLDAAVLNELRSDLPVRIQHRSGALWMLNSAGLAAAGVDQAADHPGVERDAAGRPNGRLWRADDWLRSRLPPARLPGLAPVGAALLRHGITAVTDATPDLDPAAVAAIRAAMGAGDVPQRVQLLGVPLRPSAAGESGGGDPGGGDPGGGDGRPGPTTGPYKIVLADSGLPGLDELTDTIRAAHAAGRPVAAHCVSREAVVLLVCALDVAGPVAGDRIEHAALLPAELISDLVRLGVRVVTQPGFLPHRGDDFLRDVPASDYADLYRCGSLLRAGVRLGLSSDAPYGPLDPWVVMAAATHRRTAAGQVVAAAERLTFGQALDACLAPPTDPGGSPRRVRPGLVADLIVLHVPLARVPALPEPVRAVFIDGELRCALD